MCPCFDVFQNFRSGHASVRLIGAMGMNDFVLLFDNANGCMQISANFLDYLYRNGHDEVYIRCGPNRQRGTYYYT